MKTRLLLTAMLVAVTLATGFTGSGVAQESDPSLHQNPYHSGYYGNGRVGNGRVYYDYGR